MKERHTSLFVTALIAVFTLSLGGLGFVSATDGTVEMVKFNEDGSLDLPVGYRQWQHVGSTFLPKGKTNIIDHKPTKTAEMLDIYVKPDAFNVYMKTGIWPEGTIIAKEFVALNNPNSGGVVTEDYYTGLSVLVKDSSRFPAEAGHLGYFQYGHQKEPYKTNSPLQGRDKCSFCHEEDASDQQYIFASHHIGLTRPK
ncbi:MAG: cytochrome P460 family protein [Nitrospirales bacterium]|nr:cytochrome P460 family protein [Nitrospira sp.]MDR4501625.1 cytochrome P460 family protein [Nitrospirales bacterium]